MTPDAKHEKRPSENGTEPPGKTEEIRNLEVWARSAPIRLAGYEEDLAEPHILPGID
ncbi:hypothetical protein ACWD0A_00510 [Streptomyces sp. NPDC002867]